MRTGVREGVQGEGAGMRVCMRACKETATATKSTIIVLSLFIWYKSSRL